MYLWGFRRLIPNLNASVKHYEEYSFGGILLVGLYDVPRQSVSPMPDIRVVYNKYSGDPDFHSANID